MENVKTEWIPLLNFGGIRLISYMQPATPVENWTGDFEVVRNARTSYAGESKTGKSAEADAKLLRYLIDNEHTSPLESMAFTFEVKAPIFVFRQWHRHRTWAFSELSGRYQELPEEYYIPELSQITTQSIANKQQRTDTEIPLSIQAQQLITDSCARAFADYHQLLKIGVPRELARGVLPVNTYTHMFATVNLLNALKFCRLRVHEHAQYEIQVYAQQMLEIMLTVCPVIIEHSQQKLVKNV
jgi:thymidylate synthase (FAD)